MLFRNWDLRNGKVELQPVSKDLMHALRDGGAHGSAVFGPTVYAFGEDMNTLEKIASDFLEGKGQFLEQGHVIQGQI